MLKCKDCNYVFSEDDLIYRTEPHGEKFALCPGCNSAEFVESSQCGCGNWYDTNNGDIYRNMCGFCAENLFTVDLGVEYLKSRKSDQYNVYDNLFQEFILDGLDFISYLPDKEEISNYLFGQYKNISEWIVMLKYQCLSDETDWIDFLLDNENKMESA